MALLIQCVLLCLLFTLVVMPAQYKDPLSMIMSYPPEIIKRVEELPQYQNVIKRREKSHIGKKTVGFIFLTAVLSAAGPAGDFLYPGGSRRSRHDRAVQSCGAGAGLCCP